MQLNEFPYEILSTILEESTKLNERDGVTFTFGLSQAPGLVAKPTLQKYVRGPLPPDILRWDAAAAIRAVCKKWHAWALEYAMRDVYIRKWKGAERWAELPMKRDSYGAYELIERPMGASVYRDPFCNLKQTVKLLNQYPDVADNIRRMWFNGFYVAETNARIFSALKCCSNLTSLSIPWTMARHLNADQWCQILRPDSLHPLENLELQATILTKMQARDTDNQVDHRPFHSDKVDFGKLKKLKLFGNTTFMPINDGDLFAIAQTATALEEFHLTCLDTVSIDGVMAIVKSSHRTLRVLEHSPRSAFGFYHPHPGSPSSNEHLCEVLAACPRLVTLSISIPSMCSALFSNRSVRWSGDCQVRALRLCDHDYSTLGASSSRIVEPLAQLLGDARDLTQLRRRSTLGRELSVELFFGGFIFEPHVNAVHGDMQIPEIEAGGAWPGQREVSRKGPYGSTGLYGKDEEGVFERVDEGVFLEGVRRGWVRCGA
ncbi:hypothetical protein HDK77DRAFT_478551 [Phyllosticta capitalensis]|uniref:F-box domain-containing protein n=1 Tax=Phyllosticta capitalensis TaxID=121624 RepID=A0ABR1YZ19_9PEZI